MESEDDWNLRDDFYGVLLSFLKIIFFFELFKLYTNMLVTDGALVFLLLFCVDNYRNVEQPQEINSN